MDVPVACQSDSARDSHHDSSECLQWEEEVWCPEKFCLLASLLLEVGLGRVSSRIVSFPGTCERLCSFGSFQWYSCGTCFRGASLWPWCSESKGLESLNSLPDSLSQGHVRWIFLLEPRQAKAERRKAVRVVTSKSKLPVLPSLPTIIRELSLCNF